MSIVKEVLDALEAVSNSIGHIRDVAEAVRDGRDFLTTTHPEVRNDLIAMCEEMKKSATSLATASSIITHFRFVVGDSLSAEAARFNDYLVENKTQAENLWQQLASMRGHCSVIASHAEEIRKVAEPKGLKSLAAVLGLHSPERERRLAESLVAIHDEEMAYHEGVSMMAQAVQTTLLVVQAELGPPGVIDPQNVPAAAELLGEYASAFSELESQCNYSALQLQQSIDALRA